jgi:hypothetical protein
MSSLFDEASKRYREVRMVCDAAIATTFVSLMMNGVCCMWQHHEDQEMRETLRRDMRAEYWHHRLMEHELQMHSNSDQRFQYPLNTNRLEPGQDDRRKKLMLDKMRATKKAVSERCEADIASLRVMYPANLDQSSSHGQPVWAGLERSGLPPSLADAEGDDDESFTDISLL